MICLWFHETGSIESDGLPCLESVGKKGLPGESDPSVTDCVIHPDDSIATGAMPWILLVRVIGPSWKSS